MILCREKPPSPWFAWFPVKTECGATVWLEYVERVWDAETNFRILAAWDPGDYDGAWRYTRVAPMPQAGPPQRAP